MLVFRYLARQIFQVMLAVALVLLVVAMTSRFIQYLSQAVAGELSGEVLLLLMLYRLPDFLLVILPLSLFLGILLTYGRLYAENEMVILQGSGLSPMRLTLLTQAAALVLALLMLLITLFWVPWGVRNSESLKQSQAELTEIDLIVEGQFQRFGDGERVTYTDSIVDSPQGRTLQSIFIAMQGEGEGQRIVVAESARPERDENSGARFMRLSAVLQYDGVPGRADFTVSQFDVQAIRLPDPQPFTLAAEEVEMLPTSQLFGADDPASIAELQWRLSMILLVPMVAFLAVPLSRVQPRQGRYSKLLPAAILYAAYFVLLQLSRDRVAEGELSPLPGLWWVHLLLLATGVLAFLWPEISNRMAAWTRPVTATVHSP